MRVHGPDADDDVLEAAERHHARLVVTMMPPRGEPQAASAMALVGRARRPVIVLPPESAAAWSDPERARADLEATIVAGTDGSDAAARTIAEAAALAAGLGGKLHVVHARRDPIVRAPASASRPSSEVSGGPRAAEQAELLHRSLGSITECPSEISLVHLFGEPVEVLAGAAAAERAAILAVGSLGLGETPGRVGGSVSMALLARATRPVMVVPPAVVAAAADASPAAARREEADQPPT